MTFPTTLSLPFVHLVDGGGFGPLLSVETQPSQSEAATFLAHMDLSSGRPTMAWSGIQEFSGTCPFFCKTLRLPNVGDEGRLAVLFRERTHPERGIAVLLASGPPLGGGHDQYGDNPFFGIVPLHSSRPFVFSPQVYRLRLPSIGSFGKQDGALAWQDAPGPHTGNTYTQFAQEAEQAIAAVRRLPAVVAPHQARDGALVAAWALGADAHSGFADFVTGALLGLVGNVEIGTPKHGTVLFFGATVSDTGAVIPPRVRHRSFTWGSSPHPQTERWLHARLAAPGCPWQPHQLIAHLSLYEGHPSNLKPAETRKADLLARVDLTALKSQDASAHDKVQRAFNAQRALAW